MKNRVNIIGKDIAHAAELLLSGQVIGMPTETVYGLAGIATDERAVTDIFRIKNRPHFDPLICHLHSIDQVSDYTGEIHPKLQSVMERHMPGPVTVLLDRLPIIPDLITSGLPRVAIRLPEHPVARELLKAVNRPLAAPSANPFGYISPTTAQHVVDQLGDKIPYVLDGDSCDVGVESTIVGVEDDHLVVYRKGGLPIESLYSIDPDLIVNSHSDSNPSAPGMLKSHYAPRKKVLIIKDIGQIDWTRSGFISFDTITSSIPEQYQRALSMSGDYSQAARGLFRAMRELDAIDDIDTIYVDLLPEEDLGRAINDRLRRAAAE